MTPIEYDFVKRVCQSQIPEGPVLEVGSLNVNGSIRDCFAGLEYLGVDQQAGRGVDRLMDAHRLEFPADSFATVVATSLLEHVQDPARCVREMRRVLRPGGLLIINMSGLGFPFHAYPADYWRATEQTFAAIFFAGIADVIRERVHGCAVAGFREEELVFGIENTGHCIHGWARMRPGPDLPARSEWADLVAWSMGAPCAELS